MKPSFRTFSRTFAAILVFAAFTSVTAFAQTTLYSETFTASNGTTSGTGNPANWTIDVSGTSPTVASVQSNQFQFQDLDGEAEWYSKVFYINGYSNVSASVYLPATSNMESPTNYINVYYKINGGAETLFTTNGSNLGSISARTASVSGLSGTTMQIVIRVHNDMTDENHYIDNVTVTGTNHLYFEDFSSYSNGTTTSSKWTISSSGASPTVFSVQSGRFQQTDADGQVSWTSSVIDISGCTNVSASVYVQESGSLESDDYIRVYYKLDGGSETYFTTNGNNSDDFGSRTASVSGLSGSTLQIVIRTRNSSTSEYHYWDDITVTGSGCAAPPLSLSTTGVNVSCVNPTGSIDLTFTGGQAPMTFSWSNGAVTEDLSSLTAGTYTVTVTANGVTATTSRVIANTALNVSGVVSSNYNGAHVSCPGSSNGAIDLTVSNGTPPYVYNWSTGATSQDISGLAAGSYTVTVTDNSGIPTFWSQEVNAGSNDADQLSDGTMDITDTKMEMASGRWMGLRFTNVTVPKDATITNAYIEFTAETGNSSSCSYTFYGHDTDDASAFTTSSYNITGRTSTSASVTWSSMASWTAGVKYTSPNLSSIISEITSRAGWASGNDLAFKISSTGTRYPASYEHGSYAGPKLYITYATNCTATTTVVISNPAALSTSTSVTSSTCPNSTDGAINLTVTGGTGSKTYQWSSGQTSEDISSLIMADYTVTVTDANGCTASTMASVTATGNLTTTLTVTNVTTPGGSDGAISQTPSGGTPPYTYSWSTGATSQNISGLAADYYELTITDNVGCTYNTVGKVVERVSLYCEDFSGYSNGTTTSANWTQTCGSCTLGSNGDWEVQSGVWRAQDLDAQGVWTSRVIDITGYINLTATVDLAGSGSMGTDDYIRVYYKLNGGPETLFKTNGDKTDDFTSATASQSNLMGTTLQIIIKVDNDASTHIHTFDNVCVSGELALDIALAQENVTCNGGNNGSIDLTVHNIGAIPPFTYSWSNGASTQDLSGLTAGTYNVTVNGGAYYQTDFYVVASSDDADQTTGGTMALTGAGLNMSKTANKIVGLRFQNITIPKNAVVSNAYIEFTAQSNGSGTCNVIISGHAADNTGTFTTSSNNITSRALTSSVSWNGLSSWTAEATYQTPDLQSIVQAIVNRSGWASGNSMGFELEATQGARIPYSYDGSSSKAPRLVITYINTGLVKIGSATITQPSALSANISATNTSCPNSTNGAANLTASGGTPPLTFLWSNGITSEDLTGLKTGSYTVTVTDANGCTATDTEVITSTSNMVQTLAVTNITTPGGTDGAINQTVTGSAGTKSYLWSNGATTEDLSGLAMGTYTVTVTDATGGCTSIKSATVLDPESIFCEDFSSYPNGTTTSSNWTQTCISCTQNDWDVESGQWMAYDLDNQGVWTSKVINISGYSNVRATVNVSETDDMESADYIRVYYKLDGGAETYFTTNGNNSDDFTSRIASVTGLSGSTLQIVIRVWNDAERHYFDNVCVYGYPPFYLDAEQTNLTCFGGSDGAIDLTVTNAVATPPFTFGWSNGLTSEDLFELTAGSYTVTVTDNTGLARTKTITITQPANAMSVNNTIVNVTCHGGSDGKIILDVSGGNSPYSFLWSNGSTSMNPSGLVAGTYTVTITDANGCTTSNNYQVTSPTLPLDMTFTGTPSFCFGGSTQLTASGAQNFTWTPSTGLSATNIANPVINPSTTTTYYVTASSPGASNLVANGNFESGNIGFTTQYIYTTNNLIPEGRYGIGTNANTYHPNFFSSGDHTSGTGKFMIINGAVTLNMKVWCQNLNVQNGTSYAFSTWISSVHPSNPAELEFSINGALLGTAITAPSVRYSWTQFTANWTSDTTNAEFCIVNRNTIAGGNDFALDDIVITPTCIDVDTVTVTVNQLPTAVGDANGGDNQNICYGETAELEASGGTTYSWSNGVNTAVNNVSPTSDTDYRVTVSDANGCSASDTVSIHVYPEIVVVTDSVSQIICGGASTGFFHISVSGGAPPYSYSWSNGASSQDINNVVAGIYTVTVTDNNSCTVIHTDTLHNIPDKTITLDKTDISCNNANDGAINVSVSGGNPPYTYAWSTGASAQNLAGLSAGTYTVTVTGTNDCPNSASATIVNPAALTPSALVTNITCNGLTNGAIDVSVSGGWTPYSYNWGGGVTTEDRNGLTDGSYTVTITDNRNCTATLTRSITEPAVLTTSKSITNVPCYGQSNGAIDLTVNGGTSPYTYAWSTGASTQDLTNQVADEYFVTVTDANGCAKIDSAILTEPAEALSASLVITDVTCTGIEDGTVTINATGGTAPYTYLAFAKLPPGPVDSSNAFFIEYVSSFIDSMIPLALNFTITDANNCTTTVSGEVGSEGPILSMAETNLNCSGDADGAIDLTVNGNAPFTYSWSNGATTEDLSNLSQGFYGVTVTDSVGCIGVGETEITAAVVSNITSTLTVTDVSTTGGFDGRITQTVSGGTGPYLYNWSNGAVTKDLINIPAGNYSVTITDASNCTASFSRTVDEPSACPCTWLGTTSDTWGISANWDCGFVPSDTCDVVIPSGTPNTCNIQGNAECRNLTIQNNATLIITGTNQLDIYGNLTNNGTFTRNNSLVKFLGSVEQHIYGTTQTNFWNVHIVNTSATGVRLHKSIGVYGDIRLLDGYVFTGRDTVKVETNSMQALLVFSANSFIVGKLSRAINNIGHSGYEFPVGDAGNPGRFFRAYIKTHNLQGTSRLTVWFDTLRNHSNTYLETAMVNPPTNINNFYNYNVPIVKVEGDDTSTVTSPSILGFTNVTDFLQETFTLAKAVEDDGIAYSFVAPEGEWQFEPDQQPTGGFYDMILYIENISGLSDNNFGVLKRPTGSDGRYWSGGGGKMNPFNGPGRKVSDGYAMRMMLTTFSGGGAGGGGGGGLPIELLDFDAKLVGNHVELTWATATEINNDYFTVERSDGLEFRQIAIVPGSGNSTTTRHYSKIDYDPVKGVAYYRLKQTDYDGKFSYSDIVTVRYEPPASAKVENDLVVFPNPSSGEFSIVLKKAVELVNITIFDAKGNLLRTAKYSAPQDNFNYAINIKGLQEGVYYLKVDLGQGSVYTKKIFLFAEK